MKTPLKRPQELLLFHNQISQINVNAFEGLKSLQILSLSDNQIADLDFNVFTNLNNLTRLDLRRNKMNKVHAKNFQKKCLSLNREVWL
jgi:Leucine-rich repeat (LRR) protein